MGPALTRRQKLVSILWSVLSVAFGWSLFVYWWIEVLRDTQISVIVGLVGDLVLVVIGLLIIAFAWIRHNRELAMNDRRGKATRYRAPVFETDYLKRRLTLPPVSGLRGAPELIVSADEEQKTYSTAEDRAALLT